MGFFTRKKSNHSSFLQALNVGLVDLVLKFWTGPRRVINIGLKNVTEAHTQNTICFADKVAATLSIAMNVL